MCPLARHAQQARRRVARRLPAEDLRAAVIAVGLDRELERDGRPDREASIRNGPQLAVHVEAALTGAGQRDRAYTWTASIFFLLASELLSGRSAERP